MKQPFFSIIIPIYNAPKDYFEECIRSCIGQSFDNIEILLVDDGSREECAALCDAYAAEDARIRVIHQQNQGVSMARNNGIAAANGEWLMFVDADDWLELDACERVKAHLEKQPCEMLLFNLIKECDDKQIPLNYGFENARLYDATNVDVKEFLYRRAMGSPNTRAEQLCTVYYSMDKVIKRSFLIENALQYPAGLPQSEDKVFILSCFEKLGRLYYVNDILYHYRINTASVCNRYSDRTDVNRMMLAKHLTAISERMDKELGALKGDPNYRVLRKDCQSFLFGIVSQVFRLKFYHPDAPYSQRERARLARNFIKTEPFRSAIRECKYRELPRNAKLKKLLLSLGWVSLFNRLMNLYFSDKGKASEA